MPVAPDVSGLFDNLRDDSRSVKDAINPSSRRYLQLAVCERFQQCTLPLPDSVDSNHQVASASLSNLGQPFSLPLPRLALAEPSKVSM